MLKHLLLILASLGLTACNNLSTLLFYPDTHYYQQPENMGLSVERITLTTPDGAELASWFLHSSSEAKARILFLHGNGENISTHINSVAWLTLEGYEIFLMEYRGYGASSGTPTLADSLDDIPLAHDWLAQKKPELPLFIFGQSMGGALALTYAAQAKKSLDGVISEAAPASWPQISREVMRRHWLTWLLQLPASLIPSRFDAEDHIAQIKAPLLLIHSQDDPVVEIHHLEQLLEHAPAPTRHIVTNGPHIAGVRDPKVREVLLEFLGNTGSN